MNNVEQRKKYILEEIEKFGSVSVLNLAKALDVSDMTIRRDLTELERVGLIRRIHGGAVNARGRSYEPPLALRSTENRAAKVRIGRYASGLVAEGDSISLDVGSTIYEVALGLENIRNITIVTPSLAIANLFLNRSDVRLIVPGGIVRPGETSLIGDIARRTLKDIFVDRLFMGVGAIDAKAGLTEYNLDDTSVKQVLINNAREVVVLADSSKFQKIAFAFVASFECIHHFITDREPPKALLTALKEHKVVIHVVTEKETTII